MEPGQELRRRAQIEQAANGQRVMKTGGLVVQHHVVRARNAHKVIAAGGGEQDQQVVGGVLVSGGVVGIADVATHGQSEQFAHEMVFESGADDLAFVIEILRPNKSNDAINQKRLEHASYAVRARFQGELVHTVMSIG